MSPVRPIHRSVGLVWPFGPSQFWAPNRSCDTRPPHALPRPLLLASTASCPAGCTVHSWSWAQLYILTGCLGSISSTDSRSRFCTFLGASVAPMLPRGSWWAAPLLVVEAAAAGGHGMDWMPTASCEGSWGQCGYIDGLRDRDEQQMGPIYYYSHLQLDRHPP
jgi:hypothetical protein